VTPQKSRSIVWSFNYAIEGIVYALRTQRNMRIHVAAAVFTLVGALILGLDRTSLAAIVFAISLVFIAELINTAIEAAVDVATDRYDPLAKVAKDVSAGAVLIAAMNAVVVAYLVLFTPLKRIAKQGLGWVTMAPTSLTVVALGLVLLGVLVSKSMSHEGTFMQGGWPSGHTAVAFGAATAVGFVTGSAGVLVLCLAIAALVAQSRVEGEIHSIPQVILGALLGILIVTVVFQLFFR
jgi:diacylglycerol kinase (ATP)